MIYMEFIELIADFIFIQFPEAVFIVAMTMLFSRIKIRKEQFILSVFICSMASSYLLPFGYNELFGRFAYLILIGIVILSVNKISIKRTINIYMGLFLTSVVMMLAGFLGMVPFLYLLGADIGILQENIFLMIVCSIPTRVFEYMACYLVYQRLGGENEKVN